jgi:hypothetical protein
VQWFNFAERAPPPVVDAKFAQITQLSTEALVEAPKTPPPTVDEAGEFTLRVAPPESVNPLKVELFVSQTQRTAPGPFVELVSHEPRMLVTESPFTLCTRIALSTEIRLVMTPSIDVPPVA